MDLISEILEDPQNVWAYEVARRFHEAYEELAPRFGWDTQEASKTSWEDLPDNNKHLMVVTILTVFEQHKIGLWDIPVSGMFRFRRGS